MYYSMKKLLIIGARGFGREAYETVLRSESFVSGSVVVKGFLDSDATSFDGLKGHFPPIICSPEDYVIEDDDVFFIAMGDSKWRKYYADILASKGASFYTIISRDSNVYPTATIEDGCYIGGWTVISDNVHLGKNAVILGMCTLGHDSVVGDYSTIEAYSFIGGYSKVGNMSTMHVRSTLIRHKSIGDNVDVGSCSVVIRNVKDNLHVYGNPAKKIDF